MSAIVTCPNCGKKNRVPAAASGYPRCGACKSVVPWIVDAGDAAAPHLLEVDEQGRHGPHRLHVAAGQLLTAAAALGEQTGLLQDGDVLLHRGEAHRVVVRQLGDALAPVEGTKDDVAARGVGEGPEDAVHLGVGELESYNHLVVD